MRSLIGKIDGIFTAALAIVVLLSFVPVVYSQTQTAAPAKDDQSATLTLAAAVRLAEEQASAFRQSKINEKIIEQDVFQARKAFYPKPVVTTGLIYNSPSLSSAVTPRPPSFLGANAITQYSALVGVSGEVDFSGKLKAALKRNQLLLESATSGTEIERRNLIFAVEDSYLTLTLATVRRRSSEQNLESAKEFEANTKLLLDAGEIAPVDLLRAQLQTTQRRDELEQSKANEIVAANALKVLIGYGDAQNFTTEDLLTQMPNANEIENYAALAIQNRPEFAQFEADRKVAEQDAKIAAADRKPQITYSVTGGVITDSPLRFKNNFGVQASFGVTIPLFDYGQSRSRETQARLKIEQTANAKKIAESQFVGQFDSSRAQALSARLRIKLSGRSIADAEKNLNTSQARYQSGEAIISEVTDAQNLLIAQRLALYQAIYDYQAARMRLLNLTGK